MKNVHSLVRVQLLVHLPYIFFPFSMVIRANAYKKVMPEALLKPRLY